MIPCPDCDQSTTGRCGDHASPALVSTPSTPSTPMQGWQCPQCKACFSPFTSACQYCGPHRVGTTTSATADNGCEATGCGCGLSHGFATGTPLHPKVTSATPRAMISDDALVTCVICSAVGRIGDAEPLAHKAECTCAGPVKP